MSEENLPTKEQIDAVAKLLGENPVYVSPETGKAYTEKPEKPSSVNELAKQVSNFNRKSGE